ncbi:hypothetical protein L1887_03703 [Cichorium endivia]|nr:hypothetical protein L1887_03703 [Cichorium endivia]
MLFLHLTPVSDSHGFFDLKHTFLHYSSPLHKRTVSEVKGSIIVHFVIVCCWGITVILQFTTNPQRFIKEFKSKVSDAFDRYSFNNRRDLRYRLGDGLV